MIAAPETQPIPDATQSEPVTASPGPAVDCLLLACYELGHQPLSLAWPAAVLAQAGFRVRTQDLSLESLDLDLAARTPVVAIAAPMHTALRLGVAAARQIRAHRRQAGLPAAHLCFYGLYAGLNADYLLQPAGEDGAPDVATTGAVADSVLAGEVESALAALVEAVCTGRAPETVAGVSTDQRRATPVMARLRLPLPERRSLPSLPQYAHYVTDGVHVPAGYTEASRGCLHRCRHCPITPVYQGRFFVVPVDQVMADIRQQVAAGARHITFGDPDFLNGPGHARRLARAFQAEFPGLSFDFTAKVEHLLQHRKLLPELHRRGASFVVSAFEATSDAVLERLDKGHTAADLVRVLEVLDGAGLPVRPTWVPFTPWTSLDDYRHMLAWIRRQGLVTNVPVVQLSVRLLVPPGSALLAWPDAADWRGPLDPAALTYAWRHPDPAVDALQVEVARLAEALEDADPETAFTAVETAAYAGARRPAPQKPQRRPVPAPRLTEHWFC